MSSTDLAQAVRLGNTIHQQQQKQQASRKIDRARQQPEPNAYTEEDLSKEAGRIATELFGHHRLSLDHRKALLYLVWRLTHMATGYAKKDMGRGEDEPLRLAYGLTCGGGKTLSAKAWLTAVHELGKPYSVALAASEVDALIGIKRDLIKLGVPKEKIGLLHSYTSYKGDAAPDDPVTVQQRQFALVTHALIGTGEKNVDRFNIYQGRERDLVIYDESLIVAEGWYATSSDVFRGKTHVEDKVVHKMMDTLKPVQRYLEAVYEVVDQEVQVQRQARRDGEEIQPALVQLPKLSQFAEGLTPTDVKALLPGQLEDEVMPIVNREGQEVRVVFESLNSGAAIYQKKVADSLKSVFVLDASYTIRKLQRIRSMTGTNIEDDPKQQNLDHPITYEDLQVDWLKHSSGRRYIEQEISRSVHKRPLGKMVADWINALPEGTNTLIWTFKQQSRRQPDIPKELEKTLEYYEVDMSRVTIMTHGRGRGSNEFSDAQAVAFYGVFEPNKGVVGGQMLGQQDDLQGSLDDIEAVNTAEVVHELYQEISRSNVRNIDKGKAGKGWVFLPYHDPAKIASLWDPSGNDPICFPRCQQVHREELEDVKHTRRPDYVVLARNIVDVLLEQPADREKVSFRQVKDAVQDRVGFKVTKDRWQPAVERLIIDLEPDEFREVLSADKTRGLYTVPLVDIGWDVDKRSFVRLTAEDYGF